MWKKNETKKKKEKEKKINEMHNVNIAKIEIFFSFVFFSHMAKSTHLMPLYIMCVCNVQCDLLNEEKKTN